MGQGLGRAQWNASLASTGPDSVPSSIELHSFIHKLLNAIQTRYICVYILDIYLVCVIQKLFSLVLWLPMYSVDSGFAFFLLFLLKQMSCACKAGVLLLTRVCPA